MTSFRDFALSPPLLQAIDLAGFHAPLPVQEQAIPAILEGRDLLACAPTGTGKTAAYLLPIIESLHELAPAKSYRPRALVLVPTRELAVQVRDHFALLAANTPLRATAVFGGVDIGPQELAFQQGADLVVATPGRLLEHLDRGGLRFRDLTYFVIDEADRLFDEGFLPALRRVVDALPVRRQTLLFSATLPAEMDRFARQILLNPERLQTGPVAPRERIAESFWPVPQHQKRDLLRALLERETSLEKVIVFVRQRATARALAPLLADLTALPTAELHADLTQSERLRTMADFREGNLRLLVATDVAARGLDIPAVTHVVNYDVPNTPDDYIHRVGRTARVDREGTALTLIEPHDLNLAAAIEDVHRRRIPHRRLDGFPYAPPEDDNPLLQPRRKPTTARPFLERDPSSTKPKENPFTKSGKLKRRYQTEDDAPKKPRRRGRKRAEKHFLNKKLPHQRRRRGQGPANPPDPTGET